MKILNQSQQTDTPSKIQTNRETNVTNEDDRKRTYCGRALKSESDLKNYIKCCEMIPPEQNKVENLTVNTDTSPLQEQKLKIWGSHDEHDFTQIINWSYEEVVQWKKIFFRFHQVLLEKSSLQK